MVDFWSMLTAGETFDEVDVRPVHLTQELPRVGAQALDVATLPLGEDGVEGEAGLSGSRQAGEDDQRIPRKVERHVLEVVFPRTAHDQPFQHPQA